MTHKVTNTYTWNAILSLHIFIIIPSPLRPEAVYGLKLFISTCAILFQINIADNCL